MGWVVCISVGYFLFSVILPLFVIPNLAFIKTKIQKTKRLREFSKKFKSKNKEKTLKNVYNFVIKNYKGKEQRYKVALLLPKVYFQDVEKIIKKNQFLHCHIFDRVFITLLINTGQFYEEDFEIKLQISSFGTIHQYLIVKLNGKRIKVDPFCRVFEKHRK